MGGYSTLSRAFAVACMAICSFGLDVDPPVVSLDLDESTLRKYTTTMAGVPCNGFQGTAAASHPLCRSRQAAGSREDYSKTCQAKAANSQNCPMPTARAFDHHDGELEVEKRIYLVNNDGKVGNLQDSHASVNYDLRSEWLIKFDAEDGSGNKAEQVCCNG